MLRFQTAVRLTWGAAGLLGLNRSLQASHQQDLLVLNYHAVVPDEHAQTPQLYPNTIGIGEFSRQMATLARCFHPIGASELRDWRSGMRRMPPNSALVTFDDGYRNNLTCAAPVLLRMGIPALINVSTGYIGQRAMLWPDEVFWRVMEWPERVIPLPQGLAEFRPPTDYAKRLRLAGYLREACKRLPHERLSQYLALLRKHPAPKMHEETHAFLSWEEVRQLNAKGFDIGSHTVRHPILTQLRREDAAAELCESKRVIEEIVGSKCDCFAYPNGGASDVSPEVVEQVREAGYAFAFTVMDRLSSPGDDPLMLDRIYIPGSISPAEFQSRISGLHGMVKHWLTNSRERPKWIRPVEFPARRSSRQLDHL